MITTYISFTNDFLLHYENGELVSMDILIKDKVSFDFLRHQIESDESDIQPNLFKKYVKDGDL